MRKEEKRRCRTNLLGSAHGWMCEFVWSILSSSEWNSIQWRYWREWLTKCQWRIVSDPKETLGESKDYSTSSDRRQTELGRDGRRKIVFLVREKRSYSFHSSLYITEASNALGTDEAKNISLIHSFATEFRRKKESEYKLELTVVKWNTVHELEEWFHHRGEWANERTNEQRERKVLYLFSHLIENKKEES